MEDSCSLSLACPATGNAQHLSLCQQETGFCCKVCFTEPQNPNNVEVWLACTKVVFNSLCVAAIPTQQGGRRDQALCAKMCWGNAFVAMKIH